MVQVIFERRFEFDFRPLRAVCQTYYPSDKPQDVTRAVRDAAIKAGAAREPKRPQKKRRKPETGA